MNIKQISSNKNSIIPHSGNGLIASMREGEEKVKGIEFDGIDNYGEISGLEPFGSADFSVEAYVKTEDLIHVGIFGGDTNSFALKIFNGYLRIQKVAVLDGASSTVFRELVDRPFCPPCTLLLSKTMASKSF